MITGINRAILVAFLLAAFVVHAAFDARMEIWGVRPNLGLCVMLLGALFGGPNAGALSGFTLGLLEASFASLYLGSFIVSRTLAGFLVGALDERIFRSSFSVALTVVTIGTAAVEGMFFLFAPQPHVTRWLIRTLGECGYNAALAIPLFLLIRRAVRTGSVFHPSLDESL